MLVTSDRVRAAVMNDQLDQIADAARASEHGYVSPRETALAKLLCGETSAQEFLKLFPVSQ